MDFQEQQIIAISNAFLTAYLGVRADPNELDASELPELGFRALRHAGFSVRAAKVLCHFESWGQISRVTIEELLCRRNCGALTLRQLLTQMRKLRLPIATGVPTQKQIDQADFIR